MKHVPVLQKEILEYLSPKPNENFIDATIGQGGHARLLLEKTMPNGRLLGIDLDYGQIENSQPLAKEFKERITLVHSSYANIKKIVENAKVGPVHGILLDLGFSSWQLESSNKGFSFQKDERLDMRYDVQSNLTAEKIVNEYPESELQKILEDYGQERFARQITREIVVQRNAKRIQSTFQLKEIIEKAVPRKFQHGKIHCATKTFQALRIAVNQELDSLVTFLPDAVSVLPPGARLAVISFHSLEDRIVKNFFKGKAKEGTITILTPKPVVAGQEEVLANPRARSAKLRAIIKI